jgi:hypothetical protein
MIFGYIVFFVLGVVAFFLALKLALPWRIAIALAVFIIPSIAMTVWVARTGDEPAPDAITIVPKSGAGPDKGSKEPTLKK